MEYDDSLEFIFAGHVESQGLDPSDYSPDSDLIDQWERFTDAAEAYLRLIMSSGAFDALMHDDIGEHWDADVYHTLVGAGVGVWDGRWDKFAPGQAGSISATIKGNTTGPNGTIVSLSQWADDSGSGYLPESFDECINRQAPTIPLYIEAYDGDARATIVMNQDGEYPQSAPLGWCNSASVRADADADTVTLAISTGDPRGAFVLEVRRNPETGAILLHLPTTADALPHDGGLTELHTGTLAVTRTLPKAAR
jgi:hypothetical protein